MRKILVLLCFTISFYGVAQEQLKGYKYIIIPKTLEGFKKANQYQTSTLIKYLFTQQGFTAVYDDALPQDLNADKCLGLRTMLKEESSMFATKTKISLIDCGGETVYITQEGHSKEKEYKKAYNEAIKEAFQSLNGFTHNYQPKVDADTPVTANYKDDVKEIPVPQKQQNVNAFPDTANLPAKEEAPITEVSEPVSKPISAPETDVKTTTSDTLKANTKPVWYAQEIPNGYQLVDSTPQIRLKMYKSTVPNVYHGQAGTTTGIVYRKGALWIFEYYEGTALKAETLNIKF